ncbi:MAG: Oligopeptide transport system permease protein OppB [Lentisphaerae bacterium ADurb.BinA184]|nr:MAG: Oligopeptide transport system permease protein OppB [Lentisphaerae bacterium ADurb.BinA184]
MSRFLLRRVLIAPLVLLALVSATFFLIRLAPGSPFSGEREFPPETERALMARYRLDRPVGVQYLHFLGGLARGDLGPSLKHRGRSVNEIIAAHLPVSACLGTLALVAALGGGVAAGMAAALRARRWLDYAVMSAAVLGISLPVFVIGPLLQMGLARTWKLFPVSGLGTWRHLVLPAVALALPFTARIARLTRAGFIEVLNEPFIRTAQAKGLRAHTILLRHALRGGILPVVSYLGPAVASITTGSLVVERVFAIPGLGREFIESALNRDYTLVMGTVIVYGAMIVLCNLATDLLYGVLDPRVRASRGGP